MEPEKQRIVGPLQRAVRLYQDAVLRRFHVLTVDESRKGPLT
jgi:hypothetical protein